MINIKKLIKKLWFKKDCHCLQCGNPKANHYLGVTDTATNKIYLLCGKCAAYDEVKNVL